MKFSELKTSLKGGTDYTVCVIEGADAFLRDRALSMITAPYLGDFADLNSQTFTATLAPALEACELLPFMAEKRVVTLYQWEGKGNAADKKRWEAYLKQPCESTLLVIVNATTTDLAKKLPEGALYVDCSFEAPEVVAKWIAGMIRPQGYTIGGRAARMLAEYCLCDMARIDGELQKLKAYTGDSGEITPESIEALVTKSEEYVIFDLTDALAVGNTDRAMRVVQNALAKNDSGVPLLLDTLYRFLKRIYVVASSHASDSEVANALGVKPYAVKLARQTADRLGWQRALKGMQLCMAADLDYKSGKYDAATALQTVILGISAK